MVVGGALWGILRRLDLPRMHLYFLIFTPGGAFTPHVQAELVIHLNFDFIIIFFFKYIIIELKDIFVQNSGLMFLRVKHRDEGKLTLLLYRA